MSLARLQNPRSTHSKIIVILHTRNKRQKWNSEDNSIYNSINKNKTLNKLKQKIVRLLHRKLYNCWKTIKANLKK